MIKRISLLILMSLVLGGSALVFMPEYFVAHAADKFMPPEYNKPYFAILPTAFDQMDYNIMWWVENRVGRITRFQTHDYILNSIAHAEIAAREKRLHIDFNDHPFFSFIAPSMLGMIPAIENYLHLEELLQMMPTAKNFSNHVVSKGELFDAARLIQFFETARFLESYYTNEPYSCNEITHLYFTNSPRLCSVYDQHYNLIASLDRVDNKFSYYGAKLRHGRSFLMYMHRAWNIIIKRTFVVVKSYANEEWGRRTHYPDSPFAGTRFMVNLPKETFFSKKILARKKYLEMKHFGIFPEKPKMWAAYAFKAWAMINPYYFKFGNLKFLSKRPVWYNHENSRYANQAKRILRLNQTNLTPNQLHFFHTLISEASTMVREFNQNLGFDRSGVQRGDRSSFSPYNREKGYTLTTTLLRDLQGQHFRLRDVSIRDNYGQGFGNLGRKLRNDFQWHRKITPYEMALFHNWAPSQWWGFPYLTLYHWLIDCYHDTRWNDQLYQRPNYTKQHSHFAPARLGDPGEVLINLINKQQDALNFFLTNREGIQSVGSLINSSNTKFNQVHQLRLVSTLLEGLSQRVQLEKQFLNAIESNSPDRLSDAIVDSLEFYLQWENSPAVKALTQHLPKKNSIIDIEQFLSLPGSAESSTYWQIIAGIIHQLKQNDAGRARQGIFFLSDFLPAMHLNATKEENEDRSWSYLFSEYIHHFDFDFYKWPWPKFYPLFLRDPANRIKGGAFYDRQKYYESSFYNKNYGDGERAEPIVLNSRFIPRNDFTQSHQEYDRVTLINFIQKKLFNKIQYRQFLLAWPEKWVQFLHKLNPRYQHVFFHEMLPPVKIAKIFSQDTSNVDTLGYWKSLGESAEAKKVIAENSWSKWARRMWIFSRPNAPAFNEIQADFAVRVGLAGLKQQDPRKSILHSFMKKRKYKAIEKRIKKGFDLLDKEQALQHSTFTRSQIYEQSWGNWFGHWHYSQHTKFHPGWFMNHLFNRLETQWQKWVKTAGHYKYVRGLDRHGTYRLISVPTWYHKFRHIAEELVRDIDPFIRQKPTYLVSNKLFLSQHDKWLIKKRQDLDLSVANSINLLRFYKSYLERQGMVFGQDYSILRNYHYGFRTLVGAGKYSGWSFKIFRLNTMKPYEHYLTRWSLNWRARPHKVYKSRYRRQLSINFWMKSDKSKHFRDPHQKALVFFYKTKSISCHFPNQWRKFALTPMGFCHFGNERFEDLLTKISQFQGTWLNSKFVAKVNPWWMRGPGVEGELYRHCHDVYYTDQQFIVPWTELRGGSMATNYDLLTYFPSDVNIPRIRKIFDTFHTHYSDSLDVAPYQFRPYSFLGDGRRAILARPHNFPGAKTVFEYFYLRWPAEDHITKLLSAVEYQTASFQDIINRGSQYWIHSHFKVQPVVHQWLTAEKTSHSLYAPQLGIFYYPDWDTFPANTNYSRRLTVHNHQSNSSPHPLRQTLSNSCHIWYPERLYHAGNTWWLKCWWTPIQATVRTHQLLYPVMKYIRDHRQGTILAAAKFFLQDQNIESLNSVRWNLFQRYTGVEYSSDKEEDKYLAIENFFDEEIEMTPLYSGSTDRINVFAPLVGEHYQRHFNKTIKWPTRTHYWHANPDQVWPESYLIKYWKNRPLWQNCDMWEIEEEHRNYMFPFIDKWPEAQQEEFIKILWKGPRERRYYPAEPYYFLNNMDWREIERVLAEGYSQSWWSKKIILDPLYLEKLRYYYFLKVVAAANPVVPPSTSLLKRQLIPPQISLKELIFKYKSDLLPQKTPKKWFGKGVSWEKFNHMSPEIFLENFIRQQLRSNLMHYPATSKKIGMSWWRYLTLLKLKFNIQNHFKEMQDALVIRSFEVQRLDSNYTLDMAWVHSQFGHNADALFYLFHDQSSVRRKGRRLMVKSREAFQLYLDSWVNQLEIDRREKFRRQACLLFKFNKHQAWTDMQTVSPIIQKLDAGSLPWLLNQTVVGKQLSRVLNPAGSIMRSVVNLPTPVNSYDLLKFHHELLPLHVATGTSSDLINALTHVMSKRFPTGNPFSSHVVQAMCKFKPPLVETVIGQNLFHNNKANKYLQAILEESDANKKLTPLTWRLFLIPLRKSDPTAHVSHLMAKLYASTLDISAYEEQINPRLKWLNENGDPAFRTSQVAQEYFRKTFGVLNYSLASSPMGQKGQSPWRYNFSNWLLRDKLQEMELWPILREVWDLDILDRTHSVGTNVPTEYCDAFIGSTPRLLDPYFATAGLGPLPEEDLSSPQVTAWRQVWFQQFLSKLLVPEVLRAQAAHGHIIKE